MNPLLETWVYTGLDHDHLQNPYWTIEQAACPGRSAEGTHNNPCTITTVGQEMVAGCDEGLTYDELEKRAAIIAAAPRMLRFLLTYEFAGCDTDEGWVRGCGSCEQVPRMLLDTQHAAGCEYDALLTDLGFPDTASRDAARKLIAELP